VAELEAVGTYEIVNPSDAYTITGPFRACVIATLLLGHGAYSLHDEHGEHVMPLMLFGIGGDEWFVEKFGKSMQEVMDETPGAEIAAALESVLIGSFPERRTVNAVLNAISDPAEREKARAVWHERKRSSLNDIGGRAQAMAKVLRVRKAVNA
jgi:hypothetical protein